MKLQIFKKKSSVEKLANNRKVVGAYIPTTLLEFITLYSIVHETSLAGIVEVLIVDWKKEQEKKGITFENLLHNVAENAFDSYNEFNLNNSQEAPIEFFKFIRDVEIELLKKKISAHEVDFIIELIKDMYEKNEK